MGKLKTQDTVYCVFLWEEHFSYSRAGFVIGLIELEGIYLCLNGGKGSV
jgi:hypothetical protein